MSNVKEPIDIVNLRRNTLNIYIEGVTPNGVSIPYSQIFTQTTGTITREAFANAVINKLKSTAPLNGANTTINYTPPNLEINTSFPASASDGSKRTAYISESTEGRQEDPSGPKWQTSAPTFTTSTTPPSAEVGGTFTVNIPDANSLHVPFSFQLGSYYHVFYDSTNPDTQIKTDGTTIFSTGDYYTNKYDISGKTPAQIREIVVNIIKNKGGGSVKEQGNSLIFTSNPNTSAPNFTIQGSSVVVKTAIPSSKPVLTGSTILFSQEVSVPFSVEKPFDASKLIGKGFGLTNGNSNYAYKWEFTDGTSLRSDYRDIDISGCTSISDLAAAMEAAIRGE